MGTTGSPSLFLSPAGTWARFWGDEVWRHWGRQGSTRGTSDSRGTPVRGRPYFTAVETEMRSPSFSSPHPVSPWFQPMEHSKATADGLFISTLASLPAYLRDPRPQAQQQTVYK